jgi:hypothetical protein
VLGFPIKQTPVFAAVAASVWIVIAAIVVQGISFLLGATLAMSQDFGIESPGD